MENNRKESENEKIKFTVYFSLEQWKKLNYISQNYEVSKSVVLSKLVDKMFNDFIGGLEDNCNVKKNFKEVYSD